jgi:hypothetical protein
VTTHTKTKPHRVYRQESNVPDAQVCAHRWDWTAELCAHRFARRERGTGVFYVARRVAVPVEREAGEES